MMRLCRKATPVAAVTSRVANVDDGVNTYFLSNALMLCPSMCRPLASPLTVPLYVP